MTLRLGCIYAICIKDTNLIYVGKTIDFKQRRRQHLTRLKCNVHSNIRLQNAYNKFGIGNLLFYTLDSNIPEIFLNEFEGLYINALKPNLNIASVVYENPIYGLIT